MVYVPSGSGWMRKIFPLKSLVFGDDFWESRGDSPGLSSRGAKPSEARENVLSPVVRYRFLSLSKSIPPPTWQHSSRCTALPKPLFASFPATLCHATRSVPARFSPRRQPANSKCKSSGFSHNQDPGSRPACHLPLRLLRLLY